ncbi:polymorphic toxin type 50 domain-containing protein [Roseateles amylovorans]|uniref:polymorphic toxin type 50 domain-containing protein n=1 Tax=Roseateles amylovorans TaxID=2978473 RepID=UPI00338E68B9
MIVIGLTGGTVLGALLHSASKSDGDKSDADGGKGSQGEGKSGPKIEEGKQGKHVPGHNNFQPGKSELTHPDPQGLVDKGAGTGRQVGATPVGQPGSKEVVDFGEVIGNHVDGATGVKSPTTNGTIHQSGKGVHIVPARPNKSNE